jgi:hypothetical protein
MKRFSLLFLSLFIVGLILTPALVASTISSVGTLTGTVTASTGATTGGGNWTDATTWVGGVVPTSADEVIIVSGDLVILAVSPAVGGNALNVTVQSGATVVQRNSLTGNSTTPGTFTLAANSWWYAAYGSATKLPQSFATYNIDPASNWVFTSNASSTLINALPAVYGNVFINKQGSILAGATTITDINIKGNLTVNNLSATSAVKGSNTKSAQVTTIHVGGNVTIISGVLSGVDAPIDWTSVNTDGQTCTWNIDGNVTVGDASTALTMAGLAPLSGADGGLKRTGIFNINGDLSYINGAKFEAGASGSSTGTSESAIINLKGNLTTDATVIIAANTLGTFQFNFVGSGTKTMTLDESVTPQMSFSCTTILGINKTSGDVQLGKPVTIGGHVTLTLTNGNLITTSTNIPTISGTNAGVSSGSSSSFVSGPLAYNNVSTSPKSLVYPIGKGSAFRPVTLTLTQSAVTPSIYTAEMFNSTPPSNALPGTINKVSAVRYYTISELGGGATFTAGSLLLNYDSDDGVTDNTNLRIAKDDGSGNWVDLGGTGTAITTGTILSTVVFTSLGNFVLANNTGGTNPLPVELSFFTANNNGRNIQLNWETKTEVNSNKFEIERALENIKGSTDIWASVGTIQASGTSNSSKKYSYSEKNLQSGKYQYRLKIIDNNGSYKYSNVVETEIALPKNFGLSQNYPNPFNPSTKIDYQVPVDAKVIMEVYNIAGQKVSELVNQRQSAGYYSVDFGGSKLSSGIYIYRLTAVDIAARNNFSSIKKMMLIK